MHSVLTYIHKQDSYSSCFYIGHNAFQRNLVYICTDQLHRHILLLMIRLDYTYIRYILDSWNILLSIPCNNFHQNWFCKDIFHHWLHNDSQVSHLSYIRTDDSLDSQSIPLHTNRNLALEILFYIHIDQFLLHSFQLNRSDRNYMLEKFKFTVKQVVSKNQFTYVDKHLFHSSIFHVDDRKCLYICYNLFLLYYVDNLDTHHLLHSFREYPMKVLFHPHPQSIHICYCVQNNYRLKEWNLRNNLWT